MDLNSRKVFRKLILVGLLIFSWLGWAVSGAEPGEPCGKEEKVRWAKYEEAVAQAREKGRPIMAFFYADNCRKCELLDRNGFNRPEAACYVNRKLAAARVRAEDREDLKARFRVTATPMVWFLTPEAKEIDFFVGYVDPDRLLRILRYIGDGIYKTTTWQDYEKTAGK